MSLLKIRRMLSLLIVHVNISFKRILKSIIDNCQIIDFCQMVNLKYSIGKRNKFDMNCWGCGDSYLEKWRAQWIIQYIQDLSACKLDNCGFKYLLFHSPGSIFLLCMYRHSPFLFSLFFPPMWRIFISSFYCK